MLCQCQQSQLEAFAVNANEKMAFSCINRRRPDCSKTYYNNPNNIQISYFPQGLELLIPLFLQKKPLDCMHKLRLEKSTSQRYN